jgi:signal transduction histidine kinase
MKKSTKPEAELTSEQVELLQQANDIIWSLIATMSHEVRTPATLLVGLSEYMMKQEADTFNEKQLQHLDSIHKNGRRLLETFEYFLTISRITLFSPKHEHEMEEVDIDELCKEIGLPSIEQNESRAIPHIWSDKSFLKLILEIISSLPYTEIEHKINLNISQNETQVILHITIKYNKDIIFGENDPRLRSCEIGLRNLGGQLSWEESENGKLTIQIALPIFKQDIYSSKG